MTIKTEGEHAFRDFVTANVPASGDNEPSKSEIRNWAETIDTENEARKAEIVTERAARETAIAAVAAGGNFDQVVTTFGSLDLVADANDLALTTDTGAIYYKVGASGAGSWALAFDPKRMAADQARSLAAQTLPVNYNWFNKDDPSILLDTNISSGDSTTFPATGYFTTHLVWVPPGGSFVPTVALAAGYFFNHLGVALSTCGAVDAGDSKAVPAGAYFLKAGVQDLANLDNLSITWGATAPAAYLPHGVAPMLPHAGKQLFCLGDSQTFNLPGYQIELPLRTGCALLSNGYPGRTFEDLAAVITAGEDETPGTPIAVDITGADIINVVLGTNDWSSGRALGTIADAPGVASLYGDMGAVLAAIRAENDTALVMFTGPAPRAADGALPASPDGGRPGDGVTLKQVNDAIAAFCARKSLPFCNLLENLSWDPDLLATKTSDGLHWSTGDGATDAGRQMAARINSV